MSKFTDYRLAKEIMGENFIGIEELKSIKELSFDIPDSIPDIPFSEEELRQKKNQYLLILGLKKFKDGQLVNIKNMKRIFGMHPEEGEPCFYNQDWYDKESFIDNPIENKWFLVRMNVYEDSRASDPDALKEKYHFPKAISCVYAFFVTWLIKGEKLWYHDFVWCSDVDHNGDRIYVGKYHDIDGVNKNGFSIHRHLALRSCYGCID